MSKKTNDNPDCQCGKNNWGGGGGNFSHDLQHSNLVCSSCGRIAISISAAGGNIFIISTQRANEFPSEVIDWLNTIVLPTWRAREARLEAVRQPIREKRRQEICQELGLPDNIEFGRDVPDDKLEEWRRLWKEFDATPAYHLPTGFEYPAIPPQMPTGITCYTLITGKKEWRQITREETLALTPTTDPIRIEHDKFFNQVFQELETMLGIKDILRKEIPNEYTGNTNQPWFIFKLGNNTLKLGPRNHVYAIKLKTPEPFETSELRKVTVEEFHNSYWADEGWQSEVPTAHHLHVHANDKPQIMRLLSIIAEQSLMNQAVLT